MSALLPPALLLLWSGIAATLLAAFVIAPMLGESAAALGWSTTAPTRGQGLLFGLLLLPVIYLIAFSLMHEANLINGALLGALHAVALGVRSHRHGGTELLRENGNRLILCIAYGALLGFAYVTP